MLALVVEKVSSFNSVEWSLILLIFT